MVICKNGVKEVIRRTPLEYQYNDGGRSEAGFKGDAGDCVTRAIAIASKKPYSEVRKELMDAKKQWMKTSRSRHAKSCKTSSVRNGTERTVWKPYLESLGWVKHNQIRFGSSNRKDLVRENLPKGNVIVQVRKHVMAVIDHVVHDTWDSRESSVWIDGRPTNGTKPKTIISYWIKGD